MSSASNSASSVASSAFSGYAYPHGTSPFDHLSVGDLLRHAGLASSFPMHHPGAFAPSAYLHQQQVQQFRPTPAPYASFGHPSSGFWPQHQHEHEQPRSFASEGGFLTTPFPSASTIDGLVWDQDGKIIAPSGKRYTYPEVFALQKAGNWPTKEEEKISADEEETATTTSKTVSISSPGPHLLPRVPLVFGQGMLCFLI